MSLTLDKILNNHLLFAPNAEKTAAEAPNATATADNTVAIDAARADLDRALNAVRGTEKVAGAQPVADAGDQSALEQLTKIATDLAEADELATVKEGYLYGAAAFDGFLARANQYAENVPAQATQKQASFDKYAQEINAMERAGYDDMGAILREKKAQLNGTQKTAAELEEEEFHAALEKIAEVGVDCFNRGFEHMVGLAESLQS